MMLGRLFWFFRGFLYISLTCFELCFSLASLVTWSPTEGKFGWLCFFPPFLSRGVNLIYISGIFAVFSTGTRCESRTKCTLLYQKCDGIAFVRGRFTAPTRSPAKQLDTMTSLLARWFVVRTRVTPPKKTKPGGMCRCEREHGNEAMLHRKQASGDLGKRRVINGQQERSLVEAWNHHHHPPTHPPTHPKKKGGGQTKNDNRRGCERGSRSDRTHRRWGGHKRRTREKREGKEKNGRTLAQRK
jgi:hypothetical protein